MKRHGSQGRLAGKIHRLRQQLTGGDDQAIRQLLPAAQVQQAVQEEKVAFRFCLFTPLVTVWTFLSQVLSADGSCREAVAKLAAFMAAGAEPAAARRNGSSDGPDTGPYCKARQRLPEAVVRRLARETGQELHRQHPAGQVLGGRHVKVVDGTTCSMPDMTRPAQKPDWMDEQTYQQMPEELAVREVRVRVCQRGFRVRMLVLVTTLLDAQLYSKQELARAFRLRWHVELDLRAIKQTMNMSVLRCKSPDMVRKEVWMHLLAYNLVRTLMAKAARQEGIEPREVSFAGALQAVNAFAPVLQMADKKDLPRLSEIFLRTIARNRVGNRPDRFEPKAVKRRAKPIALLTIPRKKARKRLSKSGGSKC